MDGIFPDEVWLLLDSVAPGKFLLNDVYRDRYDYEDFFNRKWHGMSSSRLDEEIINLESAGYLKIQRVNYDDLCIFLTPQAGRLWENRFSVDWRRYFDFSCDYFCKLGVNFIDLTIRSVSEDLMEGVAHQLMDFSLWPTLVNIKSKRRRGRWQWAPWKNFNNSFIVNNRMKFLGETNLESLCCAWVLQAESLRAGWRCYK